MNLRTLWKPAPAHDENRRSPSPPPEDAVEWLEARQVAATISARRDRIAARKRRRQDGSRNVTYHNALDHPALNGAMGALSSAALDHGPTSPYSHRHSASAAAGVADGERPSKRVKSEAFLAHSDGREHGRPTTSYTRPPPPLAQPVPSVREDAELLLNFFNVARSTPAQASPTASHARSASFGQSPKFANPSASNSSIEPLQYHQPANSAFMQDLEPRSIPSTPRRHPPPPFPIDQTYTQEGDHAVDAFNASTVAHYGAEGFAQKSGETPTGVEEDVFMDSLQDGGPGPTITSIEAADTEVARPYAETDENKQPQGQSGEDGMDQSLGASVNAPVKQEAVMESNGEHFTAVKKQEMPDMEQNQAGQKQSIDTKEQICAACNFHRNTLTLDTENDATSWISCDGCNKWFHFACAGFKSEREVRAVDKFRCKTCKPIHGPTTYVRKSTRAHASIDYAELNQGVVKTSEDSPEHHYIKPIKEGTIKFTPESFARIRPELVTTDFWLRGDGMQEPVVIPAAWNPIARRIPRPEEMGDDIEEDPADDGVLHDQSALQSDVADQFEFDQRPDEGQDALDMVIPRDLTVRRVAELYGPDEKLEVIDVKSQNGEDKRWNLRKWADYYESDAPNKPVRNVISLEVSQSALGRLIRRPAVVRDLDLQDSVWPEELTAKGDFPKVQFYCLMSVADCYTDFHIDFGGSSVYYHILKGKKTFFFIPPTETNLKKYEDWCNSQAQNQTFLGDQTKTCYRVDLGPGDTMLIPAGWIHAVWTPEDSLVIGGNFLTRQNFAMQIRITQIEKATGVARKFRYPSFQKVMWYTMLQYLTQDPIPQSVVDRLVSGQKFERDAPTWEDYHDWGPNSDSGPGTDLYNTRYYSKCELDGLPELARYVQRTAYIAAGYVTDGVNSDTKRAVTRSIPKEHKQHGSDFVECVRKFAMWCCWKRGNELLPHWAYPDYIPEVNPPEVTQKKLSAAHVRRLEREAAMSAERVSDRPQRERKQPSNLYNEMMNEQEKTRSIKASSPAVDSPSNPEGILTTQSLSDVSPAGRKDTQPRKRKSPNGSVSRQPACEACRKGRRACKHRDAIQSDNAIGPSNSGYPTAHAAATNATESDPMAVGIAVSRMPSQVPDVAVVINNAERNAEPFSQADGSISGGMSINDGSTPSRSKACADCRKSKRRCIHDENGRQDPVKMAQASQPRPAAKKKRPSEGAVGSAQPRKVKKESDASDDQGLGEVSLPAPNTASTVAMQQPTPVLPSETLSQPDEEAMLGHAVETSVKAESPLAVVPVTQEASIALVSPPESTHTDHERDAQTPRPTVEGSEDAGKDRDFTPPTTASGPRSRRASQLPAKQVAPTSPRQVASRAMSTDSSDSKTLDAMIKRRASSHTLNEVDEESLKLIKDLAAQDRGLRRRESRPA